MYTQWGMTYYWQIFVLWNIDIIHFILFMYVFCLLNLIEIQLIVYLPMFPTAIKMVEQRI